MGFKFAVLYLLLIAICSLIAYNCGGFKETNKQRICNEVKRDTVYIIVEK